MHKIINLIIGTIFICTSLNVPHVQAGEIVVPMIPNPGTMVHLSPAFTPAYLKGIVIEPHNALQFDFLIDQGDSTLNANEKDQEYTKLVKYFLAALTVPDHDQWVNLSPYEQDRIVEEGFGKTEMGRDLLAQDYLLKQITASLMYPESGIGKTFWERVYAQAQEQFGSTLIPVNTFNKVWITPDKAVVYQSGNTAYIQQSHLKVMLEEDYLAVSKNKGSIPLKTASGSSPNVSSHIIRKIIIPELEREVNEGKNFAQLRQVFSGMILATWYKKALKEFLLSHIYADKAKIKGIELNRVSKQQPLDSREDVLGPEQVYQYYLQAFKKGVYNFIKEVELPNGNLVPKKYFAGGVVNNISNIAEVRTVSSHAMVAAMQRQASLDAAQVRLSAYLEDAHGPIMRRYDLNQAMSTDLNFEETIAHYAMNNNDVAAILKELFEIAARELISDDGDLTLSGIEFEETYAHYEYIVRDAKLSGFEMPLLSKDMIHSAIIALYENSLQYIDAAMTTEEVKSYVELISKQFGYYEINVGHNIISQSYIEEKLRGEFSRRIGHLEIPSGIKEHIRFFNVSNSKESMTWTVNILESVQKILQAQGGENNIESIENTIDFVDADPFNPRSHSTGFSKLMQNIDARQKQVEGIIARIRKINDDLFETRRLLRLANDKFLNLLMRPIDEREQRELRSEVVRLEKHILSLTQEKLRLQAEFDALGVDRRGADRAMHALEGFTKDLRFIDRITEIKHLLNKYKMVLHILRGVMRKEIDKQTSLTLSVQDKKKAGDEYVRLMGVVHSLEEKRNALLLEFQRLAGEEQRGKPKFRGEALKINAQQGEESFTRGGIDMHADHLDLIVKYDGNGALLPISKKNLSAATMAQLSMIEGFVPRIIVIRPAANLPVLRK